MPRTILVIDDEQNMRWVLKRALEQAGYEVLTAEGGEQGLSQFARHRVDLVLLDLKMPRMDGLTVLRELRRRNAQIPVLLLTAYASIPTAVEALKVGATDYLRKPFDLEAMLAHIGRHLAQKAEAGPPDEPLLQERFGEYIGAAPALLEALARAETATQTTLPVVLKGEAGTGRRHLAHLIHQSSPVTAKGRLIEVNCAHLPEAALALDLLGEPAGDQAGGRWQQALGGSLLLSEVASLPPHLQEEAGRHLAAYLCATQRPHGLRLLVTTVGPLPDAWTPLLDMALHIQLPALRDRREDLPLFLAHFAPHATWSREARAWLSGYAWPGNVAELQRVVQQAARAAAGEAVEPQHLPGQLAPTSGSASAAIYRLPQEGIDLEQVEQDFIRQALALAQGNKSQAAQLLGISRATLLYRLDKYAIVSTESDTG